MITRRLVLGSGAAAALAGPAFAASPGERLARAARAQVGVTTGYDPAYSRLAYPGGDVPRSTGVCADVVIRAARDGLALDLQKLVHDDMANSFSAYPSHRVWGLARPDSSIDHRRVLNLEAFWTRAGARLWASKGSVAGNQFPEPLQVGDILTWLVVGKLPHVGVVSQAGMLPRVVHNIGGGTEESPLLTFVPHRAVAHYRWPQV